MGITWNEGDEVEGALYIGKVFDNEQKRIAAIAVTVFKVVGSVNVDGKRQWLLDPLELCLVEDAGDGLAFKVVWRDSHVELNGRKASKQKAFTEMVGEFGLDAKLESCGSLVARFFEDQLIETNEKMIADFDMPTSRSGKEKWWSTTGPVRYGNGSAPGMPCREKGIWQFVATDASKKDEDERLEQMERIARMGQLMLDKTTRSRKRFSQLN
jgi:hypothetical protein